MGGGGGGGNFETSLDHPSPPDPSQLQDDLAPRLKSLRKKVAHVVSMQNHRTKRLAGSRAAGNQSSYDFPAPKKKNSGRKKIIVIEDVYGHIAVAPNGF